MTMKLQRVPDKNHGFALVVALSLMVLLTILAVGLLGLSSISLRSSSAGEARSEARANARLALTLAIGEIQKSLGDDRGISARATSVVKGSPHPNLLGAWESWRWQPGPQAPDYAAKSGKFRRWLVSAGEPADTTRLAMAGTDLEDPVWLLNPSTTGMPDGEDGGPGLQGQRVAVETTGGFAWAVMDESQKAPLNLPDTAAASLGEKLSRRTAPERARPEMVVPGLSPARLGAPDKIVSLDSAVVATGMDQRTPILSHQAEVTPYSVGLLANVADGGLKTDLTTLFESSTAGAANVNGKTTLYGSESSGAPRWDYLRSHYQLSRRVSGASSGEPVVHLTSNDLKPALNGLTVTPATERLMPVILKLQIMFSAVTHHAHVASRVDFYNRFGDPAGNENYACPHLAYDPVITLYNPYDVALDLAKLRIRVWDPPVVFGFKKNNDWLRNEFASGSFHGLARFQIGNEANTNARRSFTLFLRDMNGNAPGANIRLLPGEVKVFSPWLERNWTWGLETGPSLNVRSFFDWDASRDFGNRDGRTANLMGVETVPGWDARAGFQVDHLSYGTRPPATRYDFEKRAQPGYPNGIDGGWVAIKTSDTFTVEAKPGRAVNVATQPDFVVDLLAGVMTDPSRDLLRTYRFRTSNPAAEISANPSSPAISRTYEVGSVLQTASDDTVGGKAPFAIFSMTAKTTKGPQDRSMPWLHNHPVIEGAEQTTSRVGNALDTYDLRFEAVSDFNASPGGIEIEPGTCRGYYGATSYSNGGASLVPMFRVPLVPVASLGDLIPANLVATSHLPRVTHALGNSRAHPLIPAAATTRTSPLDPAGLTTRSYHEMLDHSYLINDALWDGTYFSTAAGFPANGLLPQLDRRTLLEEFFGGGRRLLNPRLVAVTAGGEAAGSLAEEMDALPDPAFSRRIASVMAVRGPFNVNSDSVGAWKALLASLRDVEVNGWGLRGVTPDRKSGFPRAGLPLAGDADGATMASLSVAGELRWAGFRALDDDQVELLAREIVQQIRERGYQDGAPSLTVGEFINRRLGNAEALQTMAGLIQTAIDKSGINRAFHDLDSHDLTASAAPAGSLNGMVNAKARQGFSAEGAPSILTQGDLLMALAPVITVRGDTFRVRAYGESKAKDGTIGARAWCEAVVQRVPGFLDPQDRPEAKIAELRGEANKRFGRRLVVASFRWLSPEEV